MSVHKYNPNPTKTGPASRKAPVPQVDKEHFADMRKLEKNPNHINSQFKGSASDPVRSER